MTPDTFITAIAIAREAGAIVRQGFGKVQRLNFKGAVNPVTDTDTAAEALILARLRTAFPDHAILGEETGGSPWNVPGPLWLVDPLDGTNNFAHGFPHFCVSLGMMVGGEPQIGVVYDPLRDELFAARRGAGATLNGHPIHVTSVARLADAFLATGFGYNRRVAADNNTRMLDYFLRRSQGVRRAGSAALDMAYVAGGRFDGYWESALSPWDLAGGVLLVQEAGGRCSDYTGGTAYLFSGREVLVSNGLIHAEMLRVLREGPAAPHPDFPDLVSA
ncbi:MAG TPA: inositol monophosphatase family protein [Anaerolineae bacterium]|nr:inositol monophosphatase family protein [Anaerolineae bacterium]HQH39928.1 inositol monophosphatase family protein [Anaerolineae bacterium]